MMDVCYILGNGSKVDNKEIRYSLRSLEANFEFDRFYLVGERPKWLHPDVYIEADDPHRIKSINAWHKIRKACKSDISEDFLLMNDDFMILQSVESFPHYYLGTIEQEVLRRSSQQSKYWHGMSKTLKAFPNGLNFEVHTPFPINKGEWLSVMEKYKKQITRGALLRNLYGNSTNRFNRKEIDHDYKVYKGIVKKKDLDRWFSKPMISLSDSSITTKVFKRLESLFSTKSEYEI